MFLHPEQEREQLDYANRARAAREVLDALDRGSTGALSLEMQGWKARLNELLEDFHEHYRRADVQVSYSSAAGYMLHASSGPGCIWASGYLDDDGLLHGGERAREGPGAP